MQKSKAKCKNQNFLSSIRDKAGFTLVELLVVISIIGILSSLSTISVNVARERARDAKRKADISQLRLALYLYFDDNLRFPETPNMTFQADGSFFTNYLVENINGTCLTCTYTYMARVPLDPLNEAEHLYHYNSDGRTFILSYYLEGGGPTEFYGY